MLQLPDDLIVLLSTFLCNKDRKALRLVNKQLKALNYLHISRVFISPSYKNIEVFQAIAAHPYYCKQVKEIIWDDARFEKFESDTDSQSETLPEDIVENKYTFFDLIYDNPIRRKNQDEENQARFHCVGKADTGWEEVQTPSVESETLETYLPPDECWDQYTRLYAEQETIIAAGLDIGAFKDGLSAFTILERVTVTSEAYRPEWDTPCYQTPLIRSFHDGFNYPKPWPWMAGRPKQEYWPPSQKDIREHWRGIPLVLAALAKSERLVPEFIIDTHYEPLGLAYQFFNQPSDDLSNLEILCQKGLRRLDLAIHTFPYFQNPGLRELPRGRLRDVLAKAIVLEHFSLHTSWNPIENTQSQDEIRHALRAIPLESWPQLKHMTLSTVPVVYSELIECLRRLPSGIKSVDLIDVTFTERTYGDFLEQCRDDLRWTANNPRLTIAQFRGGINLIEKLCAQDEIARFFSGGPNPFEGGNRFREGVGTRKSVFDEDFP